MVGARAAIERRSGRFGIAPVDRATDGDDLECAGLRGDVLEPALELARLLEGHAQVRPWFQGVDAPCLDLSSNSARLPVWDHLAAKANRMTPQPMKATAVR
jgi:hypothetical protein